MTMMTGAMGNQGVTGGNKIPSGFRSGKMQQFTPEQFGLFRDLFSHVSPQSYLSKLAGGDEETFRQTEAPALRQFQELQGSLASRFGAAGTGVRRSSGFQNLMGRDASNFAQQLQANRQGLQRQALQDILGISQTLLGQRPYDQFLTQARMPFWKQLAIGSAEKAGEIVPMLGKAAIGFFGGAPPPV